MDLKINDTIDLCKKEIIFCRLKLHNYKSKDIIKFLKIKPQHIFRIESELLKKTASMNHEEMSVKLLKSNVLNFNEFAEDEIKDNALLYVDKIYNLLFSDKKVDLQTKSVIEDILTSFFKINEIKIKKKCFLNDIESEYIGLKFNGYEKADIKKSLMLTDSQLIEMSNNIKSKLGVTNWLNTYRKAFESGILEKEHYSTFSISSQLDVFVNYFLLHEDRLSEKFMKLEIYASLIELHQKYILSCLEKYNCDITNTGMHLKQAQ